MKPPPTANYLLDCFTQAVSALKDNRLRAGLSILGIMVGIASVIAVGTISKGGHYLIFSELETMGLKSIWVFRTHEEKDPNKAVREGSGIDNDDYAAIRAGCCPSVQRVSPIVNHGDGGGVIRAGNRYSNAQIEAVGFEYTDIVNDTIILGRPFREEDESRRRYRAILGPTAHVDLFGINQNPIGKEILINDHKFTVIGVLKKKSRDFLSSIGADGMDPNNRILIPFTISQRQRGKEEIDYFQAEAVNLEVADRATSEIIGLLQRNHRDQFSYMSDTMAHYVATANNILQGVSLIGIVAASVSILVGGLGIMNIMSTAVLARTREIGIRKAIGARRQDILVQFLMEAAFISTIGGLLGLALGGLAAVGLAFWTGFPLTPSWTMIGIGLAVSISVGLISGYYPARRAAAMRPVEALRYE